MTPVHHEKSQAGQIPCLTWIRVLETTNRKDVRHRKQKWNLVNAIRFWGRSWVWRTGWISSNFKKEKKKKPKLVKLQEMSWCAVWILSWNFLIKSNRAKVCAVWILTWNSKTKSTRAKVWWLDHDAMEGKHAEAKNRQDLMDYRPCGYKMPWIYK